MFGPLHNPAYRRLFLAQVLSLIGTGVMTVALGLLAYRLAGERAGAVLGTALFIKMIAYVVLSPIAAALATRLPRKGWLVALDLFRAAVALMLPWVGEIWQVYVLIFLLQAASSGFTPAFQATIPQVLPDEGDYTRALSLSRMAYELESLASPMLAAALLTVLSFSALFAVTAFGFLASAALVVSATLPAPAATEARPFRERLTRGLALYLATPRLRGLLSLTLAGAASSAFVIVNTVVLVRDRLDLGDRWLALALAAFGAGSMLVALLLPRLLERMRDRPVMLAGAVVTVAGLMLAALTMSHPGFAVLAILWLVLGAGYVAVMTPSGRLLRRSGGEADLPALFAAQFALSHLCWLVTYPLAGWLGAAAGMAAALWVLAGLALAGTMLAIWLWPAAPGAIRHEHPDLPPDHPHLRAHGVPHAHPVAADPHHPHWPGRD